MKKAYNFCKLCPRECGVNRTAGQTGFCGMTSSVKAARAALHFWEEPCISGSRGSGTVFFSGCPLSCVYCQNHEISQDGFGAEISVTRLADIFLELAQQGAHNINLVTPTQFSPSIFEALALARQSGFCLPVVYNTSGFEKKEIIREIAGEVDIFLTDYKYTDSNLSEKYSHAPDYHLYAAEALSEMVCAKEPPVYDSEGILTQGVIVRHLLIPGQLADSKRCISYLHTTYGSHILLSIMNQFTPKADPIQFPELNKTVSKRDYDALIEYALSLGVETALIQEGETAEESFIPPFELQGIFPVKRHNVHQQI